MDFYKFLIALVLISFNHLSDKVSGNLLLPGEEKHLSNIRQLTFGGECAEAYFSRDDSLITFQATNFGYECDQIFKFNLSDGDTSRKKPRLISTGQGRTTCGFFYPDNERIIYASTHPGDSSCPLSPCKNQTGLQLDPVLRELCNSTYIWDIFPTYDLFLATDKNPVEKRLTSSRGYDAEATLSPNGDLIVFTSMRSGDLELWTMKLDGSDLKQVTNELGYDGGAFFSPDGRKLVFRASRPTGKEAEKYKSLLAYNMVSPTDMDLFTVNVDGTNLTQITKLGGASWAPFYHPSGKKIIFSSNYKNPEGFGFNLFMINADGSGEIEQITFDKSFDSFPMFSYDGGRLIFGSMRNNPEGAYEVNVFLADWKDSNGVGKSKSILYLFCLILTLNRIVL